MTRLILYIATALTLLLLDGLMLATYLGPAFQAQYGAAMASPPLWLPALLFYAGYPALTVALVSGPAFDRDTSAFVPGALLGLAAYGTHELTNWSVLAGYPAGLAVFDIAWGTALTAVSASVGLAFARRFGQA